MTERVLTVNFLGNTAGLEAALKRTSEKLNGFQAAGKGMQSVGKSMTRNLTVPIVGLGTAAAVAAIKFQESMTRLHTQAGVGEKAVGQLSKGILDMAGSVGTTPQKLADGMYHVASSLNATLAPAKRSATELQVLKIAAEGAQVGNADLVDVTNALDAAVVSGIKGVQDYSQAMGALNSIVGAGDMTMQDLADALSTGLLAPMKTYGLTLKDVGGALATFGDNNIRGQEAATKLISAVRIMAAPSKAAADNLALINLSTLKLADDMRKGGLVLALTDLRNHLRESGMTASEQGLIIARSFGGRQSTGVQVLLHQLDRLKAKTEEVGKGAQGFGDAWAAFQKTAAFQVHKGLASIQADLIGFGNEVLPTLLKVGGEVIKGVDKVAHAFTSLPKGAQDAIIKGGLVLAAIGPAMKLLGVFTGGLGRLWSIASKIQAWGAIKTATSGTPLSTAAGKQLTSSVGTMEVGTLIARSAVGGAGGSLSTGGKSSSTTVPVGSTVAKDAAKTESGIAKVETGIAGGGLLANLKSGIGKVAGGALKGVAIAGLGTLFSQSIGEAIHGSVGKAISTIGTDTSIGAGIGAVFGPEGIIPGALLGGLVGAFQTFLKNPSHGEKIASNIFSGGFGGKQAPSLAKQTAQALDTLRHFTVKAGPTHDNFGNILRATSTHLNISGLSPTDAAKAMAAANKAGMLVAKQLEAGWNQYRFQSEPIMFAQFRDKFKQLPPEAQAKGADLAIKFAAGLERTGRLPAGATDKMIRGIEQRFPGMWRYIGLSADDGVAQFYKAMDFSKTQQQVKSQLYKISQDFPQVQEAMANTNGTIGAKSDAAVASLKRLAHGTGASAAIARRDLNRLRASTDSSLSATVALVNSKAKAMARDIGRGIPSAARTVVANFDAMQSKIGAAMANSTISVQKASKLIGSALNAMLKTENAALSPKSLAQWEKFWRTGAAGGRDTQALGHRNERGSIFQFGRAGDRGKDMIPVNFGGRQIIVGSGEVGMVLTGDQQAVLNERTADMGGLSGMIAKHDRPHSQGAPGFAKGGFPYERKLQKEFGPTTRRMRELWRAAAPLFHRGGARMPAVIYTQGNDGEFVGVDASPGTRPGHRQMFIPDWFVKGQGKGRNFTPGLRQRDPTLWETVIHEWVHEFQDNQLINRIKIPKSAGKDVIDTGLAEGGAEAFAKMFAPRLLPRIGIKDTAGPERPGDLYYKPLQWVLANLGVDWVKNGQFGRGPSAHNPKFGFQTGGQINIGAGQMGMVLTGDQQAVLNERTGDMGGLSGLMSNRTGSMPARFATGGTIWGVNPTTHQKVKHSREEWKKIWATYRRDLSAHDRVISRRHARSLARREHPSSSGGPITWGTDPNTGRRVRHSKSDWGTVWAEHRQRIATQGGPITSGIDPRTHRRVRHSKSDWGKVWEAYRASFESIPSQSTTAQIQLTLLANKQQIAENKGDTAGEQKALAAEAKLGQSMLVVDKRRLEQIKRKLHDPSISRGFHSALLADELALLQEIGSVEANIGTATSTAAGGSGSSGQFDLMPGSIKLPTVYDVHGAIAAGIAQQPHYRDHIPRVIREGREPRSIAYRDRRHELVGEGREPASHSHTHHHATRITVNVHKERHVDDVADAIDRATNGRLHAQLRAQGLRGT